MSEDLPFGDLTGSVIGGFYEVYNEEGYGFAEHVYSLAMELELSERGHHVAREHDVPVFYKSHYLCKQRVDMLIDRTLIIEIKACEVLPKTAIRQLNNYLHATRLDVGLLLHFGPEPKVYRQTRLKGQRRFKTDELK